MLIIKRNGEEKIFDRTKIEHAIEKANQSVLPQEMMDTPSIQEVAKAIERECENSGHIPTVEEVQDMVIMNIMKRGKYRLANNYITYRFQHALVRQANTTDAKVLSIIRGTNADAKTENSNKNIDVVSVQRDYIAGEVNRDLTERLLLPQEIVDAHKKGIIHFHDGDFFAQKMHNCCLVDLNDMLQNGTVITDTLIETPHSFSTACNIATQIIAQVSSCQYGGQTISLTHLAPFVDVSRKAILKEVREEQAIGGAQMSEEAVNAIVKKRLAREIRKGVQMIQYQILTIMTTNGQTPFISIAMYLNEAGDNEQLRADLALVIEEVLHQRIQGVKNKQGVWISPAFPKLLYFLEPDNIEPGAKYWYLTQLAVQCSVKRMVPDYISEKVMLAAKIDSNGNGNAYPCMGCRSFLTPYVDPETGKGKYYGRFNQGVVTVNLPYVALAAKGDYDTFWKLFDETLELCHRGLRIRHEHLLGTVSDIAPIMWQHGALARLKPGETIDKLLYGGYSTLSLGYAGLYEAVYAMTGHSHTDEEGKPFALSVMKYMNDKCAKWRADEDIAYSLYGTPIESTTYKFAKSIRNEFGLVKNVTDHGYITNSYHVNVREPINAFDKLAFESEFQLLSPGGAVSYVEVPNLSNNLDAAMSIVRFIYDNIMYAELNTKSDYCHECGYDGEIRIVEDDGKLVWECPNCGNRDQTKMNVARRTCGYIGTQFWNQGRTEEIRDRVMHVSIPSVADANVSGVLR